MLIIKSEQLGVLHPVQQIRVVVEHGLGWLLSPWYM